MKYVYEKRVRQVLERLPRAIFVKLAEHYSPDSNLISKLYTQRFSTSYYGFNLYSYAEQVVLKDAANRIHQKTLLNFLFAFYLY